MEFKVVDGQVYSLGGVLVITANGNTTPAAECINAIELTEAYKTYNDYKAGIPTDKKGTTQVRKESSTGIHNEFFLEKGEVRINRKEPPYPVVISEFGFLLEGAVELNFDEIVWAMRLWEKGMDSLAQDMPSDITHVYEPGKITFANRTYDTTLKFAEDLEAMAKWVRSKHEVKTLSRDNGMLKSWPAEKK